MFESAELGHKIARSQYAREEPKLRAALLDAQFDLRKGRRFPVVLIVGGVEGAGKGEIVNLLHSWMDAKHLRVHAMGAPTEEERERPEFWRFWRNLPPKGETGIFYGSWYTRPIEDRVHRRSKHSDYLQDLDQIERFERLLVADGALLLKFWFHISKKVQHKRFSKLEREKATSWRVVREDWNRHAHYDRYREVSEETLRRSGTGEAPWIVIDSEDKRYRDLSFGRELLGGLRRRLKARETKPRLAPRERSKPTLDGVNVLTELDLEKSLSKAKYSVQLEKLQSRLNRLVLDKRFRERGLVLAFEGVDAAGKGGAIARIIEGLDARWYQVVPVSAPTPEELSRPYLWRFWNQIPRWQNAVIFDRSWYGRVLVERVEGFCSPEAWQRAYGEINDFESQLHEHGLVVCKFWLQISPDVQLERFKEREVTHYKRYKLTDEDWRNRKKWSEYQHAAGEMLDRTSTDYAPWKLVASNDKLHARIEVLRTVVKRLERALSE